MRRGKVQNSEGSNGHWKKQFDHICYRGSDANALGGALPDDDLAKFR